MGWSVTYGHMVCLISSVFRHTQIQLLYHTVMPLITNTSYESGTRITSQFLRTLQNVSM